MKIFIWALCLILSNAIAGLPNQQKTPAAEIPPEYVIGLEDVLAVNVWREPELSLNSVTVRPDGKISLPLIGDIHASGLAPRQLQERIVERLKEFVAAPTVAVVVLKIGSRSVSIVGNVAKPGVYYLGSPMTVLELLARAGGVGSYAKKKNISIIRKEGDRVVPYRFNYGEVSKGKNLQQNIILKNGDQIVVP
jgi:polysaccharide export outer membrane protein